MLNKGQKKEPRARQKNKKFFLLLEPNAAGGIRLALLDGEGLVKNENFVTEARLRAEGAALLATTFCLKTVDSLQKLVGVVVKGTNGSFTNLRLTISVANTLAWLFDLNVFSLKNEKEVSGASAVAGFLVPHYDKEPNITKPRF